MNAKTNKQQQEEYKILAMMIKVIVEKVVSDQLKPIKKQLAEIKVQAAKQGPLVERAVNQKIGGLKRQLDEAGYGSKPGNRPRPQRKLSDNPILNQVLNETTPGFDDDDMDDGGVPSYMMGSFKDQLDESYGQPVARRRSAPLELPTTDPDGHMLDLRNVPEGVIDAMTKDYSALLQASKEKSQAFRQGMAGA